MKKLASTVWILVSLFFVLTGCEQTQAFDINDVNIVSEDRIDVPAGIYQLEYSIENWSELVKTHGAILEIEVKNKNNQSVTLTGNQITVEIDEIYTVTLRVTIDGKTAVKTFLVHAITANQVHYTVTFDTLGGVGIFDAQSVVHGGVPNLPEVEPTKEGYTFTGWFYDEALTAFCDFSLPVYENITLYAGFEMIENTVTVTFVTDGANDTFAPIDIPIGSFLTALQTPTKTGFTFIGWYLEATFETPFLVEATNIYQDTTLYAKWLNSSLSIYTVTYDLNGAQQSEAITEMVVENEVAKGLPIVPVRSGYRLEGYSLTSEGIELYDFDTPVTSDMTLYAIWLYNYTEVEFASYFSSKQIYDDSILDDEYRLVQRMMIKADVSLFQFKNDHNIDEDSISYGILYGETDTLTYQSRGIVKLNELAFAGNVTFIDYAFDTNELKENSIYYVRLYVVFEDTILYSDIESFETINVVKGGQSIGLNYVVSGGEYYHSDPQLQNHSVFYYEVLEGYEAIDNQHAYTSYSFISYQGYHRVIVTDLATNIKYLHVYKLKFDKPFVNTSYYQTDIISATSVKLEFTTTLLHEDKYTYPISDGGVLYSRSTYALLKGVPGVNDVDADFNASTGIIKTTGTLDFQDYDPYYVRSYVVLSGKIHYSAQIYQMTYDPLELVYKVTSIFSVSIQTTNMEYPFEYSVGTSTVSLHFYNGVDVVKSTYTGNGSFVLSGYYFSYSGGSIITVVERISEYPSLEGVVNNGVYSNSVLLKLDMANAYMYMSYNGGEFVYLPYKVRLEQIGYYQVFYRTATGMTSVGFEIR